MRFVILGAGGQAAVHAEALQKIEGAELAGVASATPAHTRSFAHRFETRALSATDEALSLPDVDAVVLATPTPTHADLACQAFAAGKHVFCETPISLTLADAERMITAAGAANRLLRVGLIHRFDAENRHLRDLACGGSLGAPLAVTTSRLTAPYWLKPGEDPATRHHGDAIHELLAFDVEFLIWTFGMPRTVRASAVGTPGDVTHVQASLIFDGVIAQSEASQRLPAGFPFTLDTRMGFDAGFAQLRMVFAGDPEATPPEVDYAIYRPDVAVERPRVRQDHPWVAQLKHFIRSVKGEAEPAFASGSDALNALCVCLAIEESVRRGVEVTL